MKITLSRDHLVTEIACEHGHRMLFAGFLAESDLLMHPDGYPVSLTDCKEDAERLDPPARSEWEVAPPSAVPRRSPAPAPAPAPGSGFCSAHRPTCHGCGVRR